MKNENIVTLLNELLTKACDAEHGYRHSAGKCPEYSGIRHFLESQSELRLSFNRDIEEMISRFGGKPDMRMCFAAKAHQAWISLRALVGDEMSILAECRRGEQAALEVYDDFLADKNLPVILKALLVNQRTQIGRSLEQIEVQLDKLQSEAANESLPRYDWCQSPNY